MPHDHGVALDIELGGSEGLSALGSPEPAKLLVVQANILGTMSVEVTPVLQRSKGPMLVFLRVAAIGCIVALAILALLPAPIVMRTELGGHAEHLIAYLGTAIVIGLAFQESSRLIVQCTMLNCVRSGS